jgi:hypothetical protein
MRSWSAGGLHTTLDNIIGRVSEVSEKFHKASTLGSFPRNFRKRALLTGDHGRYAFLTMWRPKISGVLLPPLALPVRTVFCTVFCIEVHLHAPRCRGLPHASGTAAMSSVGQCPGENHRARDHIVDISSKRGYDSRAVRTRR